MAVENVVCPYCGKEALATIPSGQYLIRIDTSTAGSYGCNAQSCSCFNCGAKFYSITKGL